VNRFLIPGAVFLLLAGVLYVAVQHSPNKSTMQSALLGKPAPAFELPLLGEETRRLSTTQLAGGAWVMNVWGTWCVGCREEHEALLKIAEQGAVPVIGLNWKDDSGAAIEWLRQLGNPYSAVAVDQDGRTAIEFGVYGAPETFLIDARGIIQYRHVGPITLDVWQREFLSRLPKQGLP
jgi:cytochrome c biogenesis protein CcmG, thiol:disulfide interchange protein DsbE